MRHIAKQLLVSLVACAALGAAACSSDPVAPGERPAARTPSLSAAPTRSAAGRYLVTFTGGVPADLASRVAALGGSVTWTHGGARLAAIEGLSDAAAAALATGAGVSAVEPDQVIALDDSATGRTVNLSGPATLTAIGTVASGANPATAFFYGLGFQWNMSAIHVEQAWAAGKLGSPNVTVAVIDAGIDYRSLDLSTRVDLSRSISLVPSDDALTAALFPGVHPSTDLNGHGTHVATQVASDAIAFAGVTSRTRLMSVKVIGANGIGLTSTILQGMLWATDHGADVANVSIGGYESRAAFKRDVSALAGVTQYAFTRGMLIVAGAGNDRVDADRSGDVMVGFCDEPNVVCVSATGPLTPNGWPYEPAIYTNYGRSIITVAAPGGNYGGPVSIWPWGPFPASLVWAMCSRTKVVLDANGVPVATPCVSGLVANGNVGTSLATPHVTGLAALLLAEYGKIGPTRLRTLLTARAVDLGQPGRDPYYGAGHIDVARALGL